MFESCISSALGTPLAGKVYLAAVSGGADSTAMLAGLAALREESDFRLHCVHVDHGLRPPEESRGDAQAVADLCRKLEVPCRIISITPGRIASCAGSGGPGIEAAARIFRLRAFNRERRRTGADWILTAHTRDDVLETLLMRILRGSGPAGLALISKTRGHIKRPLLELTRQDVLKYLDEKGISYRTDSTNADIRYLRNRIRHKLVPFLDFHFPSWRNSLLALGETQTLAASFIASEAQKCLPWESFAGLKDEEGEHGLKLREADFAGAPPVVREEAIFAGVDMLAACNPGKG
ncbi:MAG: tRNA lysidine(34) synthetase TilS, partial [Treponema sp.]|nr:tRNA lysidine(34) synthetase TilS [Treponema sp.]